ncbi:MAG TPA: M23 family metallopeptidase [Candidatus Angelobacter sp.]|nr:M23 family metallopeptidase [Candidatus Angelobacter sp.]
MAPGQGSHARATAKVSIVSWTPSRLMNGSPCLFQVGPGVELKSLTGYWLGHTLSFEPNTSHASWTALAGIGLETKPGIYFLQLQGETVQAQSFTARRVVRIGHALYPSITLQVPSEFTAPPPEIEKRIEEERDFKNRIFETISPTRLWSGSFTAPVETAITDRFGTQRNLNGVLKSVHQGLDFRARTGTPVAAANSGKVVVSRSLFGEGSCVMIDHGQGLLTIYMHLSEFKVHEGDTVTSGQIVGLSGGTGRATAPHLHMGVRWQGVYLDPASLFRLRLPAA